jgi:hypothetical protein
MEENSLIMLLNLGQRVNLEISWPQCLPSPSFKLNYLEFFMMWASCFDRSKNNPDNW